MIDPRLPLQYRGIRLLTTIYKFYTSILNSRLTDPAEKNNIFHDEQNGFQKNRTCANHIFSLTSIIRNRKKIRKKLPIFMAYVDHIDRTLSYYKLRSLGFLSKHYDSIKSLYFSCQASVNVNSFFTDWFQTYYGVRYGDALSPTLFGIYINALAVDLKGCNNGINIGDLILHALLYADDLALIPDSETNLQKMLDAVFVWCKKW